MFREIVLPKNNEEEFAEVASRLDIKKMYFLYDFDEFNEKSQKKIEEYGGLKVKTGFIVNQKNIKNVYKKSDMIAIKSSEKDRIFVESGKINLIYGFEEVAKRDYLHQRASGLNHVMCDLLKKSNISVGFSYGSLLSSKNEQAHLHMGRMIQNIRLCQKFKLKTVIASFSSDPYSIRSPHDIMSLFSVLGMDSGISKESLSNNL